MERRKKAEHSPEYRKFKEASDEDEVLVNYLSSHSEIFDNAKVLDVGGREGYISLSLQAPKNVTIVDDDPDIEVPREPVIYINDAIQNVGFASESFDVIIFSHILGVLSRQGVQDEVVTKAYMSWLKPGGSLILFYNSNSEYMGNLLDFSKRNLKKLRYDGFDENILKGLEGAEILEKKVVTPIMYDSFEELARACWYLFSACDDEFDSDDMEKTAQLFLPKLRGDLSSSGMDIEQKIVLVTKLQS